jgi:hypothetical protein
MKKVNKLFISKTRIYLGSNLTFESLIYAYVLLECAHTDV